MELGTSLSFLYDSIDQCTHSSVDPNANIIPVFQEDWRLLDKTDTLWRTGHDNRTRFQRGTLRKEGYRLANIEDLVTAITEEPLLG